MPKDCKTPCTRDKICNPQTGRCVKTTGTIGRRLIKKNTKATMTKKSCPNGKILNPATGRCVKTTGIIGRLLSGKTKTKSKKKSKKPCSRTRPVPMTLAEIKAQLPKTPKWIRQSYVHTQTYSRLGRIQYEWRPIKDDIAHHVDREPTQVFGPDVVKVTYQLMKDLLPRVGDTITMHVAFLLGEGYWYDGGYLIDKKFRDFTVRRVSRAQMARLVANEVYAKEMFDDDYPQAKEWIVVDNTDLEFTSIPIPFPPEWNNSWFEFGVGHEPTVYTWIKKTCPQT